MTLPIQVTRPWWHKKRFLIPIGAFLLAVAVGSCADDSKNVSTTDDDETTTTFEEPTTTRYIAPLASIPVTAAPTTATPRPVATRPPATSPPATSPPSNEVYYANCTEARNAGAAPLHRGDPGYRSGLDRDGDGVACE